MIISEGNFSGVQTYNQGQFSSAGISYKHHVICIDCISQRVALIHILSIITIWGNFHLLKEYVIEKGEMILFVIKEEKGKKYTKLILS